MHDSAADPPQLIARPYIHANEGERHPEVMAGEVRELAAHVCTLCWDGMIRLPLVIEKKHQVTGVPLGPMLSSGPRFVDQGIDLFYDSQPVMKHHRCPVVKDDSSAGGVWEPVTVRLPASFYQQLMSLSGITSEPGPAVDTHQLQAGALRPGEPLQIYTPLIRSYQVDATDEVRITRPERPQRAGSAGRSAARKRERQNRKAGRRR